MNKQEEAYVKYIIRQKKVLMSCMLIIGILLGFAVGFVASSVVDKVTLIHAVKNLRVEKLEVGFNETYVMDRMNQTMQEGFDKTIKSKETSP